MDLGTDTKETLLDTISKLMDQVERLREALRKIAEHDYSDADCIADPIPEAIWQAVARRALNGEQSS